MERLNNKLNLVLDDDLNDYAKELYKSILDDIDLYKELLDEGFSNQEIFDHIGLFADLKENRDLDKKIESFDDCIKYNHYYYFKVVRKGLNFDKVFYANKFYEEYLRYCGHFIYKDFDNEFNNVSLKDIVQKKAKINAARELSNHDWLYLTGALRSGRTYISIAFCNNFIKKRENSKVAFINCPKRFQELADLHYSDKEAYRQLIDSIKNADLVIFDDFGSEYKTSYIRDLVLKPIILFRASNNLDTIFNSSFSLVEIFKLYEFSSKKEDAVLNFLDLKDALKSKIKHEIPLSNLTIF